MSLPKHIVIPITLFEETAHLLAATRLHEQGVQPRLALDIASSRYTFIARHSREPGVAYVIADGLSEARDLLTADLRGRGVDDGTARRLASMAQIERLDPEDFCIVETDVIDGSDDSSERRVFLDEYPSQPSGTVYFDIDDAFCDLEDIEDLLVFCAETLRLAKHCATKQWLERLPMGSIFGWPRPVDEPRLLSLLYGLMRTMTSTLASVNLPGLTYGDTTCQKEARRVLGWRRAVLAELFEERALAAFVGGAGRIQDATCPWTHRDIEPFERDLARSMLSAARECGFESPTISMLSGIHGQTCPRDLAITVSREPGPFTDSGPELHLLCDAYTDHATLTFAGLRHTDGSADTEHVEARQNQILDDRGLDVDFYALSWGALCDVSIDVSGEAISANALRRAMRKMCLALGEAGIQLRYL